MELHDEEKLPKWAQRRLAALRFELRELEKKMETLQSMNRVMVERRDWYTMKGPTFPEDGEYIKLFQLNESGAYPVVQIGKGDLLFIGRARKQL